MSPEQCEPSAADKWALNAGKWRPYKVRQLISKSIYAKKPNSVPNEGFLQPSPDTAMLFLPFRWTHQPPRVTSFLPKIISEEQCWKWHHKAASRVTPYSVTGQEKTVYISPMFLIMVVASWRYLDRVRLKKVHGHNRTTVMPYRQNRNNNDSWTP